MEIHSEPVTVLRRSERLKRKHDTLASSLNVPEDDGLPLSKRVRVGISSGSNLGGGVCTHSEKSLRNRRITKAVTQSRPKTGAGAQPNVVTSIEKQKQNNLRRQESEKIIKLPKRPAEDGPETISSNVEKRPTKRRRVGTPTQEYRSKVLDHIPPGGHLVQPASDDVYNAEPITIHSLPLELLSAIIEQLWDDGCTLSSSALVCSIWRTAARPFAYRKIVIRKNEDMTRLADQIQYEPRITSWIHTLRFEGKSVPRMRLLGPTTKTTEKDFDTWIYPFFSIIGTRLPNVRTLELFGFQHMSLRREDCQVFARWILDLSGMESVECLHLARCEMPPNALTALIRSFSHLRNLTFTCVSCRVVAQNGAEFVGLSEMLDPIDTVVQFEDRYRDGILTYPVFHPPSRLHSLSIDNSLGDYYMFDFKLLENWLYPAQLADSLRYFYGGGLVQWSSLASFLGGLGTSPRLTTLRLLIAATPKRYISSGMDLSRLVNLERLILDCPEEHLIPRTAQCMCLMLAQVHTTRLEEITLSVNAKDKLECVTEMDKSLCMAKFHDLKRFNLAIEPDPKAEEDWDAMAVAKSILPGVEARGILRLIAPQKAELP